MRQLERTPRSQIVSVILGEVNLEGQAVSAHKILGAPYSGKECLYYLYILEEERTDSEGDTYVTNNYYDNSYDDYYYDDYYYSRRLRRFYNRHCGFGYYSNYYYWNNPYWFNVGWNYPFYSNHFYNPFFTYNTFGWGYNTVTFMGPSYGWGYPGYYSYYNNAYWNGHYNGFYSNANYWNSYNGNGYSGSNYNSGNYYYGHRSSMGSNSSGGGCNATIKLPMAAITPPIASSFLTSPSFMFIPGAWWNQKNNRNPPPRKC